MRRFTSRDLTVYLLVVMTVMFALSSLQQLEAQNAPTYSEIRTCFLQEKVKSFQLVDHTLTLTLRGEGNTESTMTYQISDPGLFYDNMQEIVDAQLAAGILESYDYPPGIENSWWYQMLPYLVVMGGLGIFWLILMRQRNAANNSGGGPGARFGHARTRTLAAQTVTMVTDILEGKTPELNATYANGVMDVPSFNCTPVFADLGNYEELLLESGYYTTDQLAN